MPARQLPGRRFEPGECQRVHPAAEHLADRADRVRELPMPFGNRVHPDRVRPLRDDALQPDRAGIEKRAPRPRYFWLACVELQENCRVIVIS